MKKYKLGPVIPLPRMIRGEIVWHYTGTAGFQGIIEKNALWASSPQVLNDMSEISYGEGVVKAVWKSIREEGRFLDHALIRMDNVVLNHNFRDALSSSIFIVSASEEPDLLNQWAHYGGATGFAIGLDTNSFLSVDGEGLQAPFLNQAGGVLEGWYQVIYDEEKQREAAEKLLRHMWNLKKADAEIKDSAVEFDRFLLQTLMAQMKHPAFFAEKEVRYIITLPLGKKPDFRTTPDRLIPYVSLAPNPLDPSGEKNEQMIAGINIGPSARQGTEKVITRLLLSQGLQGITLTSSVIPYLASRT